VCVYQQCVLVNTESPPRIKTFSQKRKILRIPFVREVFPPCTSKSSPSFLRRWNAPPCCRSMKRNYKYLRLCSCSASLPSPVPARDVSIIMIAGKSFSYSRIWPAMHEAKALRPHDWSPIGDGRSHRERVREKESMKLLLAQQKYNEN
jgi:hypothetical protein